MNGLVETPFKLTLHEVLCSAAVTMCLQGLEKHDYQIRTLAEMCSSPQYGFTASASSLSSDVRFVRITDIKEGFIDWNSVPFCDCAEPENYELQPNDILIARAGSVGKSFIVEIVPEKAIFASYMIRLQTKLGFSSTYVYWCLQSQQFWQQIMDTQRGSAMKNINGHMISLLKFPVPPLQIQEAISLFLEKFRSHLKGLPLDIPPLPPFLHEQQRIVERIEELAAKIERARRLHQEALEEAEKVMTGAELQIWSDESLEKAICLEEVTTFLSRGRQSAQGESEHYLIKTQHVQQGKHIRSRITLAPEVVTKVQPDAMAQPGDILIACSAAGCLGRVARFMEADQAASTDTHVAIARANSLVILPSYLYAYLKSAQGQIQLRSRERGDWMREKVGFRLTELNLADLKRVPVPLPSLGEQQQIVAYLDELQAKVDSVHLMQATTSAELDAMLPSIFDKAFRGEL